MPGDEKAPPAAPRVARIWDDPTTEDEENKETKLVDARAMLELRAKAKREAEAAAKPPEAEPTPAVGASYIALLEDAVGPESEGPRIEAHEIALSDEERAAIEAEEQQQDSGGDGPPRKR